MFVKFVKSYLARRNRVLISSMVKLGRPRHLDVMQTEYTNEYVRLSQLDLAIDEIKQHKTFRETSQNSASTKATLPQS